VTAKVLAILSLATMLLALYMIFGFAPSEMKERAVRRIIYFHVPLITAGYASAFLVLLGSVMYLITINVKWDRFSACAAEIGFVFITAQVIASSLWSRLILGNWWVWDSHTLQAVLDLIFLAYLMLRNFSDRGKRAKLSAVFGILAMVDLPFNYLSIDVFRTRHPQTVAAGGADFIPMLAAFIAFGFLYIYLFNRGLAIAKIEDEVDRLEHIVFAYE
jgi:heme exporter protein C